MPHPSRISSITGFGIVAESAASESTHKQVLALTSREASGYIAS
jgi:hypothetical protein